VAHARKKEEGREGDIEARREKGRKNKCWRDCGESGTHIHFSGNKLVQSLGKSAWSFFKKNLKIELLYDPTISILLGICLKECKSSHNRNLCTPMFAVFTTQVME
jgi:hypothetical protein